MKEGVSVTSKKKLRPLGGRRQHDKTVSRSHGDELHGQYMYPIATNKAEHEDCNVEKRNLLLRKINPKEGDAEIENEVAPSETTTDSIVSATPPPLPPKRASNEIFDGEQGKGAKESLSGSKASNEVVSKLQELELENCIAGEANEYSVSEVYHVNRTPKCSEPAIEGRRSSEMSPNDNMKPSDRGLIFAEDKSFECIAKETTKTTESCTIISFEGEDESIMTYASNRKEQSVTRMQSDLLSKMAQNNLSEEKAKKFRNLNQAEQENSQLKNEDDSNEFVEKETSDIIPTYASDSFQFAKDEEAILTAEDAKPPGILHSTKNPGLRPLGNKKDRKNVYTTSPPKNEVGEDRLQGLENLDQVDTKNDENADIKISTPQKKDFEEGIKDKENLHHANSPLALFPGVHEDADVLRTEDTRSNQTYANNVVVAEPNISGALKVTETQDGDTNETRVLDIVRRNHHVRYCLPSPSNSSVLEESIPEIGAVPVAGNRNVPRGDRDDDDDAAFDSRPSTTNLIQAVLVSANDSEVANQGNDSLIQATIYEGRPLSMFDRKTICFIFMLTISVCGATVLVMRLMSNSDSERGDEMTSTPQANSPPVETPPPTTASDGSPVAAYTSPLPPSFSPTIQLENTLSEELYDEKTAQKRGGMPSFGIPLVAFFIFLACLVLYLKPAKCCRKKRETVEMSQRTRSSEVAVAASSPE